MTAASGKWPIGQACRRTEEGRRVSSLRYVLAALAVLQLGMAPQQRAYAGSADCAISNTEIFRRAAPSVVFIASVALDPFKPSGRVAASVGSGFVVDEEQRLVITNAHVVYGAQSIIVTIHNSVSVAAAIVGLDAVTDVALLKLAYGGEVPALELGQSSGLAVGDDVASIGNPFGLDHTMSHGIVSGLNRVLPLSTTSWLVPYIQTDNPINPGNSGGPLVDRCGRAVGVTTIRISEAQNIGFAIPIDTVKEILPELEQTGHVSRPWYGVYGTVVSPLLRGLLRAPIVDGFLIETVEPGSPAEQIGLKGGGLPVRIGGREFLLGGDIITSVNGTAVDSIDTAHAIVRSLRVGAKVHLQYVHFGETTLNEAEVVLPERPVLPSDIAGLRTKWPE